MFFTLVALLLAKICMIASMFVWWFVSVFVCPDGQIAYNARTFWKILVMLRLNTLETEIICRVNGLSDNFQNILDITQKLLVKQFHAWLDCFMLLKLGVV